MYGCDFHLSEFELCPEDATHLVHDPASNSLDWPLLCEKHAIETAATDPAWVSTPLS